MTKRDEFVPGTVWTPELRRASVERMLAVLASPEMQQAMSDSADGADDSHPADVAEQPVTATPSSTAPIDPARCVFRRARPSDVPGIVQMMIAEDLPPLFIEEWLPGFVVVEHEGELIGCGGNEIYDDAACVIRSIAVDARARRMGLARRITELLIEDARAEGVTDAYLFTVDAYPFWLRVGFVEVPLEAWKESPRQSWQYQFISTHPGAVEGVHSMWKRIDG